MPDPQAMTRRCAAITIDGRRCLRNAQEGSDYCSTHNHPDSYKNRKPAKFDAVKQAKYLRYLSQGHTKGTAAASIGVSYEAVRRFRKRTPGFAELESEAELSAHAEVEKSLYNLAKQGHITAIIFWLKNRMPDRWADVYKQETSKRDEDVKNLKELGEQLQDDPEARNLLAQLHRHQSAVESISEN